MTTWKIAALLALPAILAAAHMASGQSEDLGNGFMDHGVAVPISNHRGTVATVDGEGNPVVLSWLMDHRGGYGLLMLDATTGDAEVFEVPWSGDSPFASVLSSRNRFYSHYGSHFVEFDPDRREFTFVAETVPRVAMSMTEDDQGVIWAATYPNSGVASYDPETGEFRDYGHVYDQNWAQYPRSVAADDQGWIYFGVGNTACQILILNRETGEAAPVIPEDERVHGMASVYRDLNGKVYGRSPAGQWYELYAGQATEIDEPAERNPKPIITGSQGLFHRQFPTGERLAYLDLVNRKLGVETADGETRVLEFDYPSEGAHIMGLAAASDNTICGGSAFPMRFFSYDPATDEWVDRNALGQWNTIAPTEDLFYIGAYTHGLLQVWDPSREWVPTERDNENSNPRLLAEAGSVINRPHDLLAHPDGRHVIMAGTPGYGLTGGGLLIYDMQTDEETLLTHEELLQWQSTMSLVALPDGKLLGGTTVAAGTGGERKAEQAELYIFDMETNQIEWHEPLLPGTGNYTDMIRGPDGLVFGFANRSVFFVLDSQAREIVHQEDVSEQFGSTTSGQGPRVFVQSPDGRIFILFVSGIAELDPGSYGIEMLAESPVGIAPGGDWLDGRIYFGHGSHVYSWEVPAGE